MTFLLLVFFLVWIVPLAAASLVALVTGVSPAARAYVRLHLFGPDQTHSPAERAR